jgi:hypothetical protein
MGDFGFKINEPFYIVSRMPFKRVVELTGSNLRINRIDFNRNKKQQHFVFDEVSKTIKSVQTKSYSFNIAGNGNSANLGMTTTNSRWW